jgi:hypothetical protein
VAKIQLPDEKVESPAYVKSDAPTTSAANNSGATCRGKQSTNHADKYAADKFDYQQFASD